MGVYEDLNNLSLLWPDWNETYEISGKLCQMSMLDLGIDELVKSLSINERYNKFIKSLLVQLCDNSDVIRYRLDVIEDLLRYPSVTDTFESLLPMLTGLNEIRNNGLAGQSPLLLTVKRLGELEIYTSCISRILSALQKCGSGIKSSGLCRLREMFEKVSEEEQFISLLSNLPELRSGFERLASVTIGINLDEQLRPVEAVILSINDKRFKEETFIDRLFGKKHNKRDYTGISQLHSIVPKFQTEMEKIKTSKDNLSQPLQIMLFNDLHTILNRIVEPVSAAIGKYTRMNGAFLTGIEPEIGFYLSAVKLIKRMRNCNLEMCRPEIAPVESRCFNVERNFNLHLALRKMISCPDEDLQDKVISNEVTLDGCGRIFVLTGPNQGGKTTYVQAIGVTQVLMQSGMFIPGSSARISPADNIFTHFPVEEKPDTDVGRLGEEAKRLGEIFSKATKYSVVILNESLASTSPGESLYMCEDIIRGLRLLGSRAIFATHLHDLALRAGIMNTEIPGDSPIVSMVAGVDEKEVNALEITRRTYKVIPSPPRGMSYARDIASRFGISFEQISATLAGRNIKT